MKIPRFALLLLLFLRHAPIVAQDYQFSQKSLSDGLSQSSINAMVQDERGFWWFGTQDGLNRYDGYEFKVFKNIPFDASSLGENFITALCVDGQNRLWVGTLNAGLHLFLPETETFARYTHFPNDASSISNNNITTIEADAEGNVWVGTPNGLNLVRIKNEKEGKNRETLYFQRFHHDPNLPRSFPHKHYVHEILKDSKGQLWVGTANGLFCFQIKKEKKEIRLIEKKYRESEKLINKNIQALTKDKLGRIWVGMLEGVEIIENTKFEDVNLTQTEGLKTVNDLLTDEKGNVWAATYNGLFLFKFENKKYKIPIHFFQNKEKSNTLHDNMIHCIAADREQKGLYWLGTYLSGIGQMYERKKLFLTNYLNASIIPKPVKASVHQILKDSMEVVWANTTSGLVLIDRNKNTYNVIERLPILGQREELETNRIAVMYRDSKGRIWLGTRQGLFKVVQRGRGVVVERFQMEIIENGGVFGIFEAGDFLYLGGWKGINRFNLKTQTLDNQPVVMDSVNSQKYGYQVQKILKDRQGNWWVGTTHGLLLYRKVRGDFWQHLQTHSPEIYTHTPSNRQSLTNDRVMAICEDPNGQIWLGTQNGLIKVIMKAKTLHFQPFDESSGLANNLIYAMAVDSHYLWVSSNKGLSRFNLLTERFANFDIKDGLQSNEFNGSSFFQADDGELFFGGINGFTSFYPHKIRLEKRPPKIFLTNLNTDKKTYNLLITNRIRLKYIDNSFSVQFIGLDFLYPTEVAYFYRLEGKQQSGKLLPLGNSRQVNFTELGAGQYVLRVFAQNRDGAMNQQGDAVRILIEAPFWQTPWFFALLIALIAFLFWTIYHIRYLDKMKQIAEIEQVRKNAAQDFHDEMGSKLTVISMFSELTKSKLNGHYDEVAPYLSKVSDTASSLYHSMKDLIWALNPEQDTVQDLYLQLKDFGDELFDQTGVEFRSAGFESDLENCLLPMEYKRHILLIFKELMNNALKHSDCSEVSLRIYSLEHRLKIELHDNGMGFNVDDPYEGDGLKNIYSRAQKIGGEISICSTNRGTSVTLKCPVKIKV